MPYPYISLLSDYGWEGGFVGALHAVAFGIAPGVPVVDLDHAIPRHDVRLGALRLERMMRYAPPGVHVAIVDPGVGTPRRPLALEAAGRVFVGPDNGLLVWAARRCGPFTRVTVLEAEDYWLSPRSRTFDGRDVFVPVAAHVAAGVSLAKLGPEVDPSALVLLPSPVVRRRPEGGVELEVVAVDGFGNVQLAGDRSTAASLGWAAGARLAVGRCAVAGTGLAEGAGPVARGESGAGPAARGESRGDASVVFAENFADVAPGAAVLYVDSDDLLAVAVNQGRADALLGVERGELVSVVAEA